MVVLCRDTSFDQRCAGSGFQDSSPAGFSTFWTNCIESGLRFYSSFRIWIFKFHCFGIWRQDNHKKNFCKVEWCNAVHINYKCVKEALLHRMCHALQSSGVRILKFCNWIGSQIFSWTPYPIRIRKCKIMNTDIQSKSENVHSVALLQPGVALICDSPLTGCVRSTTIYKCGANKQYNRVIGVWKLCRY